MRLTRLACGLVLAVTLGVVAIDAQGRPGTAPPGPPSTPVPPPVAPPADPPDSLIEYVCSILPVPYLCDID